MLHELKNIIPSIDFGFGTATKVAQVGETFTVWLSTLYNQDAYSFFLQCEGSVTNISDYEYEVSYDAEGEYNIQLTVVSGDKKTSLESNVLTVTIV